MRKKLSLTVVVVLSLFLLTACGGAGQDQSQPEEADTVTTASIVSEGEDFKEAISADGEWIIAALNDLDFEEPLTVEGTFYDGGDSENDSYRKLALYAQDDDRNVTDRYTLTAPELIIKSPNTRFQAGTFVGDIIVEADGFELFDAEVEGNIYFAEKEYQESANISEDSEVTGEVKVQN